MSEVDTRTDDLHVIRTMTKGAYDLQKVRIATGLRLCANFRSRLMVDDEEEKKAEGEEESRAELSDRAKKVIEQLKVSYRRLTDGIAKNRTLPQEKGFTGDELIHTHAELALIHTYVSIEKQEAQLFRLLEPILDKIPIYSTWLKDQSGVGPAMAAIIIWLLDPREARHVSSFWKIAGLDLGPDGRGRSRREEHL